MRQSMCDLLCVLVREYWIFTEIKHLCVHLDLRWRLRWSIRVFLFIFVRRLWNIYGTFTANTPCCIHLEYMWSFIYICGQVWSTYKNDTFVYVFECVLAPAAEHTCFYFFFRISLKRYWTLKKMTHLYVHLDLCARRRQSWCDFLCMLMGKYWIFTNITICCVHLDLF